MNKAYVIRLVFGLIAGIALIVKREIHKWVDKEKNHSIMSPSGNLSSIYWLPYLRPVRLKTKGEKMVCNALWSFFIIALMICMVFGNFDY